MTQRKIILVDDQPSYRNVIKTVLSTIANIEVVGEANNGLEFLELLKQNIKPEIVFMDIEMPLMDGINATRQGLEIYPEMIIIGLSMYENQRYIDLLMGAGAHGYLLKLSDNFNLFETILKYPQSNIFFSEKILQKRKQHPNNNKILLIIENEEKSDFLTVFSLENAGYKVLKTKEETDISEQINTHAIDLIICEEETFFAQGKRLYHHIRSQKDYTDIPFLIITANKNILENVSDTNNIYWISKPFHLPDFLKIINELINN